MMQPKQVSAGTGVLGNAEFERFDDALSNPSFYCLIRAGVTG